MPALPSEPLAPAPTQDDLRNSLAGAPWGLISYRPPGSAASLAGLLDGDGQVRELEIGAAGMLALLADWDAASGLLASIEPDSLPLVPQAEVTLPLSDPPKIVCAGANYHSHVSEMGGAPPPPDVGPYFFLKPPSTTMIGEAQEVNIGAWEDARIDWEVELAIVIGRRTTRIAAEDAMASVAGYVVVNDITDRARLHRDPNAGPPFAFDWVAAKARDRSFPVGTAIVPSFLVGDAGDLPVRLWVNDELKQDSTTAEMIFDIPTLISAASETMTLEPGDLLATGTPAGVGHGRSEYLRPGDSITARIDGIGQLRSTIAL